MTVSSTPAWHRPSTLLLATIVAVNLTLPLVHFWPGETGAEKAGPGKPRPAASAAGPQQRSPASAARIEPIRTKAPAKRVAMREAAPVCLAWGPFAELAEAESLAARLQLRNRRFEVFESVTSADTDYLVTVHVPGPRDAVERVLEELQSRDIDNQVLRRGRLGNVLSVGVFSDQGRAEAQRRRMAELGHEAAVEALDRSRRIYHLMARIPADLEPEIPAAGVCSDIAPMHQFL
jgi:cell division protein FtsN